MPKIQSHRDPGFYPLDPRENDPTKCFRLFSGGFAEATNTGIITAGGARSGSMVVNVPINEGGLGINKSCDLSVENAYSSSGASFIRLTGRDNGANVSRSWLCERWLPKNGQLFFNRYEMEATVRCRYFARDATTASATSFCPRIGFSGGHQDFSVSLIPSGLSAAACFTVSEGETTWRTHSASDLTGGGSPDVRRIDTGIRADEWHTLRVWVSASGDEIVYSIDGVAVDRVTDPKFIATRASIVSGGDGMSAGAVLRGLQTGLTNYPQLDIEWCLVRMFMDR